MVVTADWLNQSLSLLDYGALVDGSSSGADALIRTIDLSAWAPGPLEVELTPDGATAVVSVGPAFFSGSAGAFIGSPSVTEDGTLLIVDLASGQATEVVLTHVPMGIALSPDGARAYTANYGTGPEPGNTLSVIDVANAALIEEVEVSSRPEQVALSPDGTLGIINSASANGVHLFETADIEGTLTELIPTGSDPSDVTFLGTGDRAVVVNSFSFDAVLLDTSDLQNVSVIDTFSLPAAGYGVTYLPVRDELLAPSIEGNLVATIVSTGDVLSSPSSFALDGGAFPLAAIANREETFAFVAHIHDRALTITDLESGTSRSVHWLTSAGPSYVAVQP